MTLTTVLDSIAIAGTVAPMTRPRHKAVWGGARRPACTGAGRPAATHR